MDVNVRRKTSIIRDYQSDYLDIPSRPLIMKILDKQGNRKVLFADIVLKFTDSGKVKRCILLITDFAVYIVDPNTNVLKRRITLDAVEKICMSESSDNFFAIIIPNEYDLLMASTRKTEIANVLVEATKSASNYDLDVLLSNRFEYKAAAGRVKEVQFEDVEGKYWAYEELSTTISSTCHQCNTTTCPNASKEPLPKRGWGLGCTQPYSCAQTIYYFTIHKKCR